MSLGEYPLVSFELARLRQEAAKAWIASGVDPATRKLALWRVARGRLELRRAYAES